MLPRNTYFIIISTFCLWGCSSVYHSYQNITGYDFSKPDKSWFLPDTLREVSGIANIDSITFACVQDENGILFLYDVPSNEIKEQFIFHEDGDYEGITLVGNTIYVLQSDGILFEIENYQSERFDLKSYDTGIPSNNNEGLCYDPDNNRLLIAAKGKIGKGHEFKDKRVIYGFDLATKKLSDLPIYDFDLQVLKNFAIEKKLDLPTKTRKHKGEEVTEPIIKFMTSAICIHPITKKLYLLSASDHMLFIFNESGTIEHMEILDPKIYNKAEGITFYSNGDMLVTNEAQDKKPTLLFLKYLN